MGPSPKPSTPRYMIGEPSVPTIIAGERKYFFTSRHQRM
jgi:hypothetical protein